MQQTFAMNIPMEGANPDADADDDDNEPKQMDQN